MEMNKVALLAKKDFISSESIITCYNCKEPGHIACNCPKPKTAEQKKYLLSLRAKATSSDLDNKGLGKE